MELKDFIYLSKNGFQGFIRKGFEEIAFKVLEGGERLKGGRGFVFYKDGVVGRRYRRGGFFGKFFGDLFFWEFKRPLKELEIAEIVRKKGIPTPEPLGVLWRRKGFFLEAWFFSEFLKGKNLLEVFSENTLRDVAKLIRILHDNNINHRDLNIKNFLVSKDGKIFVLDFDRASLKGLSFRERRSALQRLLRSICKEGMYFENCEKVLEEGYGERLGLCVKWYWSIFWRLGI